MNQQDVTEELHHPGARDLLDSATLLRLGYNGSDGFPRVIPIGFHWDGNQIVICTAATAPKVEALSSRPEVALTIDVGDTPTEAKALLMRGVATLDIADGVPDEYVAASRKALDADQVAEFERHAGRSTTRWRASGSSRNGHGCSTSALVACRGYSRRRRSSGT